MLDAEALGTWELGGRKGGRPEPTLPAIEADIERRQLDLEGLRAAVDQVAERKVRFVSKHRKRLRAESTRDAREALARYHQAIDAVAQAREDLRAARHDELWCALYPDELAGRDVADTLCGDRKAPLRRMGLEAPVAPGRVIEALHDDADWIRGAATQEQFAALHDKHPVNVRPGEPPGSTTRRSSPPATRPPPSDRRPQSRPLHNALHVSVPSSKSASRKSHPSG